MALKMTVNRFGSFKIDPSRCRKGQCGFNGATEFFWSAHVTGDGARLDGNYFLIDSKLLDAPFDELRDSSDPAWSCEEWAKRAIDGIKREVEKARGSLSGFYSIRVTLSGDPNATKLEAEWTR